MEKLEKVLQGENQNYLFPFFWQHGEDTEIIEEYMDKIAGCGMKAACIEARPHPEFLKQKWWDDLDTIIKKAKQHDMKLWILDDSHFPTGYADGRIKEEFPELKKWYLDMRRFDVVGPLPYAKINMKYLKGRIWEKPALDEDEYVLKIFAARRASNRNIAGDPIDVNSLIDITGYYDNKVLTWSIPTGNWCVFVMIVTRKRGEEATQDYLNPLVKEATQVLLDTVYEPHRLHYESEFGKTILGFFSDEPRFGNQKGMTSSIGRQEMVLPWRIGLEKELNFEEKYLPLLFVPASGAEKEIRFQYMDCITRLYNENFTAVLAGWCEKYGLVYLGHNIEDNGAHARLGYGSGHYFRAQEAQHFSGIDVIGGQIVPGMPYHHDSFSTGGSDGEFYHFALAKLGASAAHLDEKKKGRAMCEAYGAYGWNEGLKLMKWITDHLLVRGINYIVPHAFSPKEFPDWDCPPHFYAQGHNPQFRYFPTFTKYANRMMELLNGGVHRALVAVLYPAEAEWGGAYMPVEQPVRELTEMQIDCDIVSIDYLKKAVLLQNSFQISEETFQALVVPYAEYLPEEAVNLICEFSKAGVDVIFVNQFPDTILIEQQINCHCVPISELAEICDKYREIKLDKTWRDLVYYHYEQSESQIFMFFNESVSESVDDYVLFPNYGYCYQYDAFENELLLIKEISPSEKNIKTHLSLAPYESKVFIFSKNASVHAKQHMFDVKNCETDILDLNWKLSFAGAKDYPNFKNIGEINKLTDLRTIPELLEMSGTAAYEAEYGCQKEKSYAILELDEVWEIAEVFVNGVSAGVKICGPYRFDISKILKRGKNKIRIEVTNTLGNSQRDALSQYLVIEPFGITSCIKIMMY
jgi:hypothetical protein